MDGRRVYVSQEVKEAFFAQFLSIPGNNTCIDCDSKDPKWCDTSHGTAVCIECIQRQFFPRSITMDSWTTKHLLAMSLGGNDKLRAFAKKHPGCGSQLGARRYRTSFFVNYREQLQAKVRHASAELPTV